LPAELAEAVELVEAIEAVEVVMVALQKISATFIALRNYPKRITVKMTDSSVVVMPHG
jgi:hypothetical protein